MAWAFTFDDTDKKGVATPLAEMRRLIHENPRNREVVFPFIGGEEVNTSPIHAHHRYVINFRTIRYSGGMWGSHGRMLEMTGGYFYSEHRSCRLIIQGRWRRIGLAF